MIQYRVQFDSGRWIYLSKPALEEYLSGQGKPMNLDIQYPYIPIDKVECIERENISEGKSTIIKPKTAAELREEKERKEKEEAPVTLDEQLAKVV